MSKVAIIGAGPCGLSILRAFEHLEKKGDLIRWSIVDIQDSIDSFGTKKLKIKAVLAN